MDVISFIPALIGGLLVFAIMYILSIGPKLSAREQEQDDQEQTVFLQKWEQQKRQNKAKYLLTYTRK